MIDTVMMETVHIQGTIGIGVDLTMVRRNNNSRYYEIGAKSNP